MLIKRLAADILGKPFHVADQPSHGVAPPDLEPALKRAQMPYMVAARVSGGERRQELPRRLIWIGLEELEHFHPIRFQRVWTTPGARFWRLAVP
jgi:hypothetical protein